MQGTVTLHGWVAYQGDYIRWKLQLIVVPSWASHKPTAHKGVRNITIMSVETVTTGPHSVFRNWEVILSGKLVFVIFFNSLCTLTIQAHIRSGEKPGHSGEPCHASVVARQRLWPPTLAGA